MFVTLDGRTSILSTSYSSTNCSGSLFSSCEWPILDCFVLVKAVNSKYNFLLCKWKRNLLFGLFDGQFWITKDEYKLFKNTYTLKEVCKNKLYISFSLGKKQLCY